MIGLYLYSYLSLFAIADPGGNASNTNSGAPNLNTSVSNVNVSLSEEGSELQTIFQGQDIRVGFVSSSNLYFIQEISFYIEDLSSGYIEDLEFRSEFPSNTNTGTQIFRSRAPSWTCESCLIRLEFSAAPNSITSGMEDFTYSGEVEILELEYSSQGTVVGNGLGGSSLEGPKGKGFGLAGGCSLQSRSSATGELILLLFGGLICLLRRRYRTK